MTFLEEIKNTIGDDALVLWDTLNHIHFPDNIGCHISIVSDANPGHYYVSVGPRYYAAWLGDHWIKRTILDPDAFVESTVDYTGHWNAVSPRDKYEGFSFEIMEYFCARAGDPTYARWPEHMYDDDGRP